MRLLADEDFPINAVTALRDHRYDVLWIRTDAPGSPDDEILARAVSEARVIITFDKDFGELAFRSRLPASCGIILFRITATSSAYGARTILSAVQSRDDWTGQFAVVEENRIRIRVLPES